MEEDNFKSHKEEFSNTMQNCIIIPEYYKIKSTKKTRLQYVPRNVVDRYGMKIYHEQNTKQKSNITIPVGHKILVGDL